jgi:hypothetical protein
MILPVGGQNNSVSQLAQKKIPERENRISLSGTKYSLFRGATLVDLF